MPDVQPYLYAVVLAAAVGLGLPAGTLVIGAGALYGPQTGLLTVLAAEIVGLAINWRLCRGVLRPRFMRWLQGRKRGRTLRSLLLQPAELRELVLLRLAMIPMNLVNAGCALGPTRLGPYGLASLVLAPRFAVMVLAGAAGGAAARDALTPLGWTGRALAVLATAAIGMILLRRWRQALQ
jgi:uncharacterized membrane protein YdjX (TVP38/TMEM64 family)